MGGLAMRWLLCVLCAAVCIHGARTGDRGSPATSYQSPEADRTAETDILKVHPGNARALLGSRDGGVETLFNAGYQAATKAVQCGESSPTPPLVLAEAAHDPQAAETTFNAGYTAGYQAAM